MERRASGARMTAPLPTMPPRVERPSGQQRAFAQRTRTRLRRRHVSNGVMIGLTWLAAAVATLPLIFILWHLLRAGASSLSLDFFTKMPKPVGESVGGMANAIFGTLFIVGIAAAVG